jgi:uncharacterized protein YukE
MIPVVQSTWKGKLANPFQNDFDINLPQDSTQGSTQLIEMLEQVLSRQYTPKNNVRHNNVFQISRGMRGISL